MNDIVLVLQQLIAIPSISGQEKEVQKWIFIYLKTLSFNPIWIGLNVSLHIPGKDKNTCLIFNGHVDTVTQGDGKLWKYQPFEGKIIKNSIYGLGATDMKGGVAVMLILAKQFASKKPPIDLWFHFVVKEETDGSGTGEVMKDFVKKYKSRYRKIAGIIAEPTDLKEVTIAHKGNIFLQLTTYGTSGHGSQPEKLKKHAVKEMVKAERKLTKLVQMWKKRHKDSVLGFPTSIMTSLTAGNATSPNKIADTCTATFDVRTTPSIHTDALREIKKYFSKNITIDTAYDPLPPGYTNPHEDIVKIAQDIAKVPIGVTPGSTDLLFFTAEHIPAIILGPGKKNLEHKVNEYCEIDKLDKCLHIYKNIIEQF